MMKIAIAGTNGFAQYLAYYIHNSTPYQFMMLSQRANPDLAKKNWQIIQVKYESVSDKQNLTYLLMGVDVVISTIAGPAQLVLVDAAADANVNRFVPSEFGGKPHLRSPHDPTDDSRREALRKLNDYESQKKLHFTVFSCGLFYERFAPKGLTGSQINISKSLGSDGNFLVNMRDCLASVPCRGPAEPYPDEPFYISITSARDAARCVVEALSLREWPRYFTFHAQRLSIADFINICQRVKGRQFQWLQYDVPMLRASLNYARISQERSSVELARAFKSQVLQLSHLLAIAEGVYDLRSTNLNSLISVDCEDFERWLRSAWSEAS